MNVPLPTDNIILTRTAVGDGTTHLRLRWTSGVNLEVIDWYGLGFESADTQLSHAALMVFHLERGNAEYVKTQLVGELELDFG